MLSHAWVLQLHPVCRRSTVAARQQHRFNAGMYPPKLRGRTFHRTADVPSLWLVWAVRWHRPHAETHPEAVLATSSCWWQRGSTPRWVSHGLRPLHGVHRSAACARTRTRCPFCTALSRPRADRISLLPSQVARSSRPSPLTMARDRGRASLAAAAATSLSAARGGASTVVRLYGACAHVACMHMHCTAYRHAY